MAKKNSLKLAPYAPRVIHEMKYDETLTYNHKADRYWETEEYKRYQASGVRELVWEGHTLMEYTHGRPGEQETTTGWSAGDKIDWRPNEPFEATLTIRALERGRSAARFWFEDEENKVYYPFFGQTLVDMLSVSDMSKGKVTGTWIVVKKGSNYGIEAYQ